MAQYRKLQGQTWHEFIRQYRLRLGSFSLSWIDNAGGKPWVDFVRQYGFESPEEVLGRDCFRDTVMARLKEAGYTIVIEDIRNFSRWADQIAIAFFDQKIDAFCGRWTAGIALAENHPEANPFFAFEHETDAVRFKLLMME